eukprot:gene20193-26936_t
MVSNFSSSILDKILITFVPAFKTLLSAPWASLPSTPPAPWLKSLLPRVWLTPSPVSTSATVDTGIFGFTGVCSKETCEDFAYYGMNNMTKLCYDVSEAEVAIAKNKLKADLMAGISCTSTSAATIGRDLLVYGRPLPKVELLARIDAVDAKAINGVADRFVFDQDMAIASVGDVQFMPDMTWFRKK